MPIKHRTRQEYSCTFENAIPMLSGMSAKEEIFIGWSIAVS
jgi:hypothetical protein